MQSQAYNQHEESAIKKTVMKIIEAASPRLLKNIEDTRKTMS